jgi:hypothetical protein
MVDIAQRSTLLDLLRQTEQVLTAAVAEADTMTSLPDTTLLEVAELAGRVQRLSDAAMVRVVQAVEQQCRVADREDSLAARHGLRDGMSLLMVLTGAGRHTLTKYRRIAAVTSSRGIGSTGVLPPTMPHLATAMTAGAIGLDQALVVREALHQSGNLAHPDALEAAELALVAAATGAPDPFADPDVDTATGDETAGDNAAPDVTCSDDRNRVPLTPDLLAVQARAWRDAIDPDGAEPSYELQRQRRSFTLGQRPDGMWVGKLLLPADQGAALRLTLDAHNAPRSAVRHDSGTDHDSGTEPPGVEQNHTVAPANRTGNDDTRTSAQRQADTLVGLAMRAAELADAPRIGGEAPTLVVTITADQLNEHAATGGGTARVEHSGDAVPAHVAARIICDGLIQTCLVDDVGLPLKLGRARRIHTKHQRRAILLAYPGGCQNPHCGAPPGFTEIHHPVWWSHDGPTDADNGFPLCPYCHSEVHAGRLTCVRDAKGRWIVVPTLSLRPRGWLRSTA